MRDIKMAMLFFPFRIVVAFLSYQPLMVVVLTSVSFLIFSWISLTNGEPNLSSLVILLPVLKWLGFAGDGTYGISEVMAGYMKVAVVVGIGGLLLDYLSRRIFKHGLKIEKKYGFVLITSLFLFCVLSFFLGYGVEFSISALPVLVTFWIIAMGSYVVLLFLNLLLEVIDKLVDSDMDLI